MKLDHIRFLAHDFLNFGFTLQTSRINNKRVISTFKFGYPHLTLKEGPKVKLNHIRRFLAHDFLYVGFILQTSRTSNKRVTSTFAIVFKLQLIYSTVRMSNYLSLHYAMSYRSAILLRCS